MDTETDNTQGFGLNPPKSRFTDISMSTDEGDMVWSCLDEAEMIKDFANAVYDRPAGLMGTWNGTHFDLPFLDTRIVALQHPAGSIFNFVPTPDYKPKYDLLPGHDMGLTATVKCRTGVHVHWDISYIYKPIADRLGVKWGLKPVAEALGLPIIELDREHLDRYSDEERRRYAASDSWLTRQLTLRALGVDIALALGR